MAQSLAQIYIHIIFSTKNRFPFIDLTIEEELYAYLAGICIGLKCYPKKIGGHSNHVHILCQLSKTISTSEFVEILKTRSSIWMKNQRVKMDNFYWQKGYAVYGVNHDRLAQLSNYIANQHQHHDKKSFEEEYRSLLTSNEIQFDERYMWE